MKKLLFTLSFASSLLLAQSIKVEDAYTRATPPHVKNSAAFMKLKNNSDKDISLLSASSDVSNITELHTHGKKDGVMKMYQVPKIDIKAKSSTILKPGGFHIMLIGLKNKSLKEGQKANLVLNFSNGEKIKVIAPVKKVMAGMHMKKHNIKKMEGK